MRRFGLLIAAPLLLAVACGQAAQSAPTGGGRELGAPAPAAKDSVSSAVQGSGAVGGQGLPTVIVSADRNLILSAKVDMRSKDPWATSAAAQRIATSLGGDILGLTESGTGDSRSASLTFRVPSARFADAIAQIKQLEGEVATSAVSAQDVTDQFVDLQARLAAKQAEEQRYLQILNRANTIDEILKVDSSLANVRTQIEQLTGQINSIKQRTDFSTISMSISTLSVLPGDTTGRTWDPAKTVGRALAALGAMLQVFADAIIWLVVFGWLPLLAFAVVVIAMRRRPASPATPTA